MTTIFGREKMLSLFPLPPRSYLVCSIHGKQAAVHRLVATAFIPNPENKSLVNHINGIPCDNRVGNLEWVTISENVLHAHGLGLIVNYAQKLTHDQIREIRKELAAPGRIQKQIAEKYGVTQPCISGIKLGRLYRHVKN